MTHPFHPQLGFEFEPVAFKHTWGEHRVYFLDDSGNLRSFPARWTSAVEPDPFLVVAAGRAHFRPEDLVRLIDLVAPRSGRPRKGEGGRQQGGPEEKMS